MKPRGSVLTALTLASLQAACVAVPGSYYYPVGAADPYGPFAPVYGGSSSYHDHWGPAYPGYGYGHRYHDDSAHGGYRSPGHGPYHRHPGDAVVVVRPPPSGSPPPGHHPRPDRPDRPHQRPRDPGRAPHHEGDDRPRPQKPTLPELMRQREALAREAAMARPPAEPSSGRERARDAGSEQPAEARRQPRTWPGREREARER